MCRLCVCVCVWWWWGGGGDRAQLTNQSHIHTHSGLIQLNNYSNSCMYTSARYEHPFPSPPPSLTRTFLHAGQAVPESEPREEAWLRGHRKELHKLKLGEPLSADPPVQLLLLHVLRRAHGHQALLEDGVQGLELCIRLLVETPRQLRGVHR